MILKVRHAAKGDLMLKPSNLLPIIDFKNLYIKGLKKQGSGITYENIRMFAMGKEL